jgi:glutaredoxin 2
MKLTEEVLDLVGSVDPEIQSKLNEDLQTLDRLIKEPGSVNATKSIQDAIYGILFNLAQIGKTYPAVRFAIRRAIQDYLRGGY